MRKRENQPVNYKRFISDFNTLVQYTEEERPLYQRPSYDDIDLAYDANLLKDKQGERYGICCDIEEFRQYGPGIYLLFSFTKLLIGLFVAMSLFAIVNVAILASGSVYTNLMHNTNTFEARIAVTTIGNMQQQYYGVVPIVYFVSLIVFTIGIVYWREKEPFEVIQCFENKILPSYYTAILTHIPEGYSEAEIKNFLQQQFGDVKEIFSVKEFNDDIIYYKEINDIIQAYKMERGLVAIDEKRSTLSLITLFSDFYENYLSMKERKRPRYQPAFAFITFRDVAARERLLTAYNARSCCSSQVGKELLYKDQVLRFEPCKMQPDAINWENVSLTTKNAILRILLQIALLAVVLVISVAIIYLLALAQTNLSVADYGNYSRDQVIQLNNSEILKSYCLNLAVSNFAAESDLCGQYKNLFVNIILLQAILPLIISVLKFIFTEIMKYLVIVRRHATEIKKIESQIVITFIFYFILSGLVQLVIDIQIVTDSGTSVSISHFFSSVFYAVYNLFPIQTSKISLYSDFNVSWYLNNSSKIVLISVLSFNISSIFSVLYSVVRKCLFKCLACRQQMAISMNKYLKGEVLQIQFIYAFALSIIFFTLLFGPVMPILWIFGTVSIILLYWSYKYIFINYCQQPLVYGHSINHLITKIILFGICLSSLTTPLLIGGVFTKPLSVTERYMRYIYYPALGVAILAYMLFKKVIANIISFAKRYCVQNDEMGRNTRERLPTIISQISVTNTELPSYSMHENPHYSSILKVLYTMNLTQRHRGTFMLNQNLNDFLFHQSMDNSVKNANPFSELVHQIRSDLQRFTKEHAESNFNPFEDNPNVHEIYRIYKQLKRLSSLQQADNALNCLYPLNKPDRIIEQLSNQQSDKVNSHEQMQSERKFIPVESKISRSKNKEG